MNGRKFKRSCEFAQTLYCSIRCWNNVNVASASNPSSLHKHGKKKPQLNSFSVTPCKIKHKSHVLETDFAASLDCLSLYTVPKNSIWKKKKKKKTNSNVGNNVGQHLSKLLRSGRPGRCVLCGEGGSEVGGVVVKRRGHVKRINAAASGNPSVTVWALGSLVPPLERRCLLSSSQRLASQLVSTWCTRAKTSRSENVELNIRDFRLYTKGKKKHFLLILKQTTFENEQQEMRGFVLLLVSKRILTGFDEKRKKSRQDSEILQAEIFLDQSLSLS